MLFRRLCERSGRAVLGKRSNLIGGVADGSEHFFGVSAECGARAVGGLIVGECEGAAHGYEFADLASLVDLNECVAVIKALIVEELFGRDDGTDRNTGSRKQLGDFIFVLSDGPGTDAFVNLLFVAIACVGGIEIGIGEPVLESESLACFGETLCIALQNHIHSHWGR